MINQFARLALLTPIVLIAGAAVSGQGREIIENRVPAHLPIKVEILYGERSERLENAEIKVTNTGKRQIYYLDFILSAGKDSGLPIDYGIKWFRFGRTELRTLTSLADSDDPSLNPGETILFQVQKKVADDFRKARRAQQQNVQRYQLIFQVLSFGDGTGFTTTGGLPFPEKSEPPFSSATDRHGEELFELARPKKVRKESIFEKSMQF